MSNRASGWRWIAGVLLLAALGCQSSETPERVAITFLELYVFKADQKSALELAADAAAQKLRDELADLQSVRALGGDFANDPRRPALARELLSTESNGNNAFSYLYRIEARPKGGEPTYQRISIQVARREAKWRVVEFRFLPELPAPG